MKEFTILRAPHLAGPFRLRKSLRLIALLALAASLPLLGGCIFSPKRGSTPPPPPSRNYLVASSPQNVFNNLIKSYADRDSTNYKACFDVGYVGSSYNGFDGDPPQPATYYFDDEARHIAKLQTSTTVLRASLELPSSSTSPMDTLAGDPTGWVTITIHNPSVVIDELSGSHGIFSGETFEYKFQPKVVPTDQSPTGKLWYIIRWREIAP
jgi:hypothetical protein